MAERLRIRIGARPSQLQRAGGATGSDPSTVSPNTSTGSPTLHVPITPDTPGSARGSARAAAAAGGPPRQQSGRMHVPSTARHPGAAALRAAREKQVSCRHTYCLATCHVARWHPCPTWGLAGAWWQPMLHVLSECTSRLCTRSALRLAEVVGKFRQHRVACCNLPMVQHCCLSLVSLAGACCECTGAEAGQARSGRAVLHLPGPACYGWAAAWIQVRRRRAPSGHRMSCHPATNCCAAMLRPC